jgi:hypothetical protein
MLQAIFDFFTFWKVTGSFVPDIDGADEKPRGMEFHYAHEESALGLSLFRD